MPLIRPGVPGAQTSPSARRTPSEFALLLLCARLRTDAFAKTQIEALLQEHIDWDSLITAAHKHRVLPLVYLTLRGMAGIPDVAMSRLRNAVQANVRRNLFLTSELLRVIELFRKNGIPSIPYKGPAVASLVYGDVSLRQFADLDVIVPSNSVVLAKALLVERGYRAEKPLSDDELAAFVATEKDITLLHDSLGINLEIHWGVVSDSDPIHVDPAFLWENLRTHTIAGRPVQTLRLEDLLLILCIHGAKHRWERLVWLCDVAEIVRTPGWVDWNVVLRNARRLGSGRILFLGLALASDLLGAELPPIVLRAIAADSVLNALVTQVKGWLLSEQTVPLDLGERERYFMRLREHSADRLRLAIKQAKSYLALTVRDSEALSLPGFLEWSRYVVRPIRLAGQYGITPFIRFFKGIFQS